MAKVLLLYSTTDGHTVEICKRLGKVIEGEGDTVELANVADGPDLGNLEFDKVVIGASIRYGKHQKAVYDFVRDNQATLEAHPNALFSVNVVARKPEKNTPETNPYVKKFLRKIPWKPRLVGVFAGRLDYEIYDAVDRNIIRLIMWLTGGPTDLQTKVEYTDWDEVRQYASKIIVTLVERRIHNLPHPLEEHKE